MEVVVQWGDPLMEGEVEGPDSLVVEAEGLDLSVVEEEGQVELQWRVMACWSRLPPPPEGQ